MFISVTKCCTILRHVSILNKELLTYLLTVISSCVFCTQLCNF